jgi:hypothetical protein
MRAAEGIEMTETPYVLEVGRGELRVIVAALRIQQERWSDALLRKVRNDPEISAISIEDIKKNVDLHQDLLNKLPNI